MAYNGRQARYQDVQYQARPQDYSHQYNGYDQEQYGVQSNGYHQQYHQGPERLQHDLYAQNQQYSPAHEQQRYQYSDQRQYPQTQPSNGLPYDNQAQQQRQYQYDDRFRTNSQDQQQQIRGGRDFAQSARRSAEASRPGTSASSRRPKERILQPEEPKAIPWDNPFGVFPGTKKDVEKKKKEQADSGSRSRAETPVERPPTSASSRPRLAEPNPEFRSPVKNSLDEQRPHTSHGRRPEPPRQDFNQAPRQDYNQSLGILDDMPLRKKLPPSQQQQDSNVYLQQADPISVPVRQGLPARPAPQRSMTGPLPEPQYDPANLRTMPRNDERYSEPQHQEWSDHNSRQDYDQQYSKTFQSQQPVPYSPQIHDTRNGQNVRGPAATTAQGHVRRESAQKTFSNLAYRGVEQTRPRPSSDEAATPNFATTAHSAVESVEKELAIQVEPAIQNSHPQPYRKPTYGDVSSKPPPIRPGLVSPQMPQVPSEDHIQSPVGGFDFGLAELADTIQQAPNTLPNMQLRETDSGYGSFRDAQTPRVQGQSQFPPRQGSRADPRIQAPNRGFVHSYNKPPVAVPRVQDAQPISATGNQPCRPSRNEYGFDDQGYPRETQSRNAYGRNDRYNEHVHQEEHYQAMQPLARTYTEPVNQQGSNNYNHGYDQRAPPSRSQGYQRNRPDGQSQIRNERIQYNQPQAYDQYGNEVPSRPRTANSARAPVRTYPDQSIPVSRPPNSAFPIADRNHPPPIRPGLIESAPAPTPSPAPAPQISPPRTAQTTALAPRQASGAQKIPVTIQELNALRKAVNDRPNDDKLGLKFAKRLVEAASVLASEGGKADPKTTAKNRERYINDAYRVVKRLVANGSPDAMFYLADSYGQGHLGLEVNPKEAFQLYTSAAKIGHAQSAYRVAVCCELGADGGGGTRRDHAKAVQYYKRAATLGDGPAMFKMGMILLKGLLAAQPNRREGISWLKRAAERADEENPHALHELGLLYENAQSTDVLVRDERYALQLFTQAANLGYKYSQYRLGSAYEYGTLSVNIDPRTSIAWYSKAAAQAEHQSEFALSGWYLTGSEPLLQQSDTEAYLWARKAAQSGLAKAEYAMGYYSEVGIGCQSNIDEAKKWYFRAAGKFQPCDPGELDTDNFAAQGDNRAKERLEEIKRGGARKEKTRISRTNVGKQNEGECSVM